MSIDLEIKEVKATLKETGENLKKFYDTAQAEMKKHGDCTAETKAAVDKLLCEQGALRERQSHAEQLIAKLESGELKGSAKKLSIGELAIQSEEFKALKFGFKGKVSTDINAVVTSLDSSAGDTIQPLRAPMVNPVERRLLVEDLLAVGNVGETNAVEYVREEGFTNNAAPVSENPADPKPESDLTFTLLQAPVVTIAHFIHASRQVLSDSRMLASYINQRLIYGLRLVKENQILNGSGAGLNMEGLVTQATAYANPGVTVANETAIDRLRLAMLQVQLAEYVADGIVLNPIDWAGIELTKDNENRYIFTNPTTAGAPTLWGTPIVATQSMAQGEYLTGAFRMGAQVWNREGISVQVSTEDRDNFVKNMVTILAELRAALTVYRPEAFVTGEFESGLFA